MPDQPTQLITQVAQTNLPGTVSQPILQKETLLKRILPWIAILSFGLTALTFATNANLRRKELTFAFLGAENLVHIDRSSLKGSLSIRYQDVPISELYRLSFSVRNSGSSAIREDDIKEPIEINFPKGYVLLDPSTVEETRPQFKIDIERNKLNAQALDLMFPLLNPGDEARFSVDALYIGTEAPFMSGRIVDVRNITNIDLSKTKNEQRSPLPFVQNAKLRSTFYWLVVLYNLVFGTFCVIYLGAVIRWFIKLKRWEGKWGSPAAARGDFAIQIQKNPPKTTEEYQKMVRDFELAQANRLAASGAPSKPNSVAENWKDFAAATAAFLALAFLSILTLLYVVSGSGV